MNLWINSSEPLHYCSFPCSCPLTWTSCSLNLELSFTFMAYICTGDMKWTGPMRTTQSSIRPFNTIAIMPKELLGNQLTVGSFSRFGISCSVVRTRANVSAPSVSAEKATERKSNSNWFTYPTTPSFSDRPFGFKQKFWLVRLRKIPTMILQTERTTMQWKERASKTRICPILVFYILIYFFVLPMVPSGVVRIKTPSNIGNMNINEPMACLTKNYLPRLTRYSLSCWEGHWFALGRSEETLRLVYLLPGVRFTNQSRWDFRRLDKSNVNSGTLPVLLNSYVRLHATTE